MRYPIVIATLLAIVACKPEKKAVDTPKGVSTEKKGTLTAAEQGEVVARVGDRVITLAEFEKRLNQQSPFARSRYTSLQRKKEFLDSLVRFELLALDAEDKGFHQDPDVVLAQKQAMVKKLTGQEIRGLVKMSDITDADVKAYYDEHIGEFDKPEEVRASHILLADEAKARAVLAELLPKIAADPRRARQIFADFVRLHSTDEKTKRMGGDLQFFGKPGQDRVVRSPDQPTVSAAIANVTFALEKVGDVHPEPLRTGQGWHLVQKTGFRRPYKRELDDVKASIRNKLFRIRKGGAMEKYVQDLKAKANVRIDQAVLDKAKIDPNEGPKPSLAPPFLRPGGGGPPGGRPRGLPGIPPPERPGGGK